MARLFSYGESKLNMRIEIFLKKSLKIHSLFYIYLYLREKGRIMHT